MALLKEKVTSIHHWTDKTFSFKTTRNMSFRFKNGEFAMIGLEIEGKPLLRAYSVVSPNHEDHLEFLSIKVPNGPLTSKLQHIKIHDEIIVNSKPTGTLVCDYLLPGRNLYLFSTGTGLAPFMSIVRDPETYEKLQEILGEESKYYKISANDIMKDFNKSFFNVSGNIDLEKFPKEFEFNREIIYLSNKIILNLSISNKDIIHLENYIVGLLTLKVKYLK